MRNTPMRFCTYCFSSVFETDAMLPEYKGSTFRGVFGHALKKVVCALKHQECHECLLREKCVYAFVFEIPAADAHTDAPKRLAAPPHPYVIEPPETTKTHYRTGDPFDFSLLLFGKANEYLPYFIYAFDHIGSQGVGKHVDGERGIFRLQTVSANNTLVYSHQEKKIVGKQVAYDLSLDQLNHAGPVSSLHITLRTPLRLKFQNKLEATLPFHIFVRALLRRVSSLCQYYGAGEPALDYPRLVKQAYDVLTIKSSLGWHDWRRYSNKQDQAMLMGGMVGGVTYAGDLTEYVPLIRFCEQVHLGKQTSFGLGKITVEEMSSPSLEH